MNCFQQQMKPQREVQKKRKQTLSGTDEPESKMNKTEGSEGTQEQPEKNGDDGQPQSDATETKPAEDGGDDSPQQEEKKMPQVKQTPVQGQEKHPKMRKRRGFLERVMFACSVCKFRSFYKDEMETHLESRFHKDHFKFLSGQLSKPTTDFLQEYLQNKFKKTEQRVSQLENHCAAICQVYKEQDLTRELGMEHFMRKVEAAHCAACDLFIPMQPHLIQKHIKSHDHNYNRKGMMEQSKRGSLSVARSILNHKLIGKKLESYLKGENPFAGNQDDAEDSMVVDVSELDSSQAADGQAAEAPEADKTAPEGEVTNEPEEVQEEGEPSEDAAAAPEVEEQEQEGEEEEEEEKMEEEHEPQEDDEDGFEVGEDEEDEGFVVHDEIGEEGVHAEEEDAEEEGVEGGDNE